MRPNKETTADKRMDEIIIDLQSRVPVVLRKALGKVEAMMESDKTSDSNVLRACDSMYKMLKELQEAREKSNINPSEGEGHSEDEAPKVTSVISMFANK